MLYQGYGAWAIGDLIDDKLSYSMFQDGNLKDAILQQKINSSRIKT